MKPKLRIVFMGTPEFSASILRRLAVWEGVDLAAVYCREDKPAGRGHKLTPPSVKLAALEYGLPVRQVKNFKKEEDRAVLAAFEPDMLVVAAYGLVLPQEVLDIPCLGALNVHASLLPRYRGSSPIQRAIMDEESVTGITIMRMEASLDTGPMLSQRALAIDASDTAATLHDKLATLGSRLLLEVLDLFRKGESPAAVPQNDALATYAARLEKQDGCIEWDCPAHKVHARIRGVTPWPGARASALLPGREPLSLLLMPGRIGPVLLEDICPQPGTIVGSMENCLAVTCADRLYFIPELRISGKQSVDAVSFWNGYKPRNTREYGLLCQPKPRSQE